MQQRNGTKRTKAVEHVVETRSRTKQTPPEPVQNGKRRVRSNGQCTSEPTNSASVNGFYDVPSSSTPKISPRKLRELQELAEMSKWMDPGDGKHPRTTRRALMSQRTGHETPVSSRADLLDVTPKTRSTRSGGREVKMEVEPLSVSTRRKSRNSIIDTPKIPNGILKKPGRVDKRKEPLVCRIEEPPKKKQKQSDRNKGKQLMPPRKPVQGIRKKKVIRKRIRTKRVKPLLKLVIKGPLRRLPRDIQRFYRKHVKRILKHKRKIKKPKPAPKPVTPARGRPRKDQGKRKKRKPVKSLFDAMGIKLTMRLKDKVKVSRIVEKMRLHYRKKVTSRIPSLFAREMKLIKRTLRLKRPRDARSLLPIPAIRLTEKNLKFKIATRPVKSLPLKNGIKWLALLTPCQRSCTCKGFQTDEVRWKLKMPHSKAVHALKAEDLCIRCRHPLWQHRRKYSPDARRDRYAVLRDIRILQTMMLKEKDKEKFRVFYMLWKDMIALVVENQAVPRTMFMDKHDMENQFSITQALQQYMQSKEAKKLGFIYKHAVNLLKTLDDFKYPSPSKPELLSLFFALEGYDKAPSMQIFQKWYRHYYEMYIVYCQLPHYLLSLPQFQITDIMNYHFLFLVDQYVSLKFEERYAETGDPEIKIVAVLFKKLMEHARDIKTISRKMGRRAALKHEGENVLAEDFVSEVETYGMGMRHAPLVNQLLVEETGPKFFRKLPPAKADESLQVDDALRFCYLFWKAKRRKELSLFMDRPLTTKQRSLRKHPEKLQNIKFVRDPHTLADFNNLNQAMNKKQRKSLFTSNCDRERDSGKIEMFLLRNQRDPTETKRNDFLLQFVTVIHRQLPRMPKHYILKLVMDRHHKSLVLVKHIKRGSAQGWIVLGGICFRPFVQQQFSEVVFVAVHSDHQVRGYGGYLMDHLKKIHAETIGYPHLLTFADKNAIGYFKKQGFLKESEVDQSVYDRHIKEYDGATLMYCHSRTCNTDDDIVYWASKLARMFTNIHKIYCPEWYQVRDNLEKKFLKYDLIPMSIDRAEKIDQVGMGLSEADIGLPKLFWQDQYETMWKLPHLDAQSEDEQLGEVSQDEDASVPEPREVFKKIEKRGKHYSPNDEEDITKMYMLLEALYRCPFSWPFHYPVDEYDAPTYHDEISRPVTLEMIEDRLHWGYYLSVYQFISDINLIFTNCYFFNTQLDGFYYHSGFRLHQYYNLIALQIFGQSIKPRLLPIPRRKPTIRKVTPKITTFTFAPPKPYWYPASKDMPVQHIPPTPQKKKTPRRRRRNSAVVRVSRARNRPKKLILRRIKPEKKKKQPVAKKIKKETTTKPPKSNGTTPLRQIASPARAKPSTSAAATTPKSSKSATPKPVKLFPIFANLRTPSPKRSPVIVKAKAQTTPRPKAQIQSAESEESRRQCRASTRQATYVSQKTAPPLRKRGRR